MGTSTQINQTTQTTSNIGPAQQPYYNTLMQGAQGLLNTQMPVYDRERIEGFTPQQKNIQGQVLGMQAPGQFGIATDFATKAGLGLLNAGAYTPGTFNSGQVEASYNPFSFNAERVTPERIQADKMQAAQTGYNPNLTTFQMAAPERFGQEQAQQYMSPYMQSVVDVQKREATRDARQQQLAQDLGAARQGTYGGSRQLLATLGRERMLGQQLGDIQARGLQSAYEQAANQFGQDRAALMQAQQQNLAAQLGVQELGTNVGLQTALANLSADQQARVQNMAAENQARGMNAENALRAALANQQTNLEAQRLTDASRQFGSELNLRAGLANQQSGLEAQRLGEQSRQFGSGQGLAALGQVGQMGQTLGNLGTYQQQADVSRLGMQQSTAAQEQALLQQMRDVDYQDFLREMDYPYMQLQRYGNLLSAVPQATTSATTSSAPAPSLAQQIMGTGLAGLSAYNMLKSPV